MEDSFLKYIDEEELEAYMALAELTANPEVNEALEQQSEE